MAPWSNRRRLLPARLSAQDERTLTVEIPPWGFLEGFELLFPEPAENMDARLPYRFQITAFSARGWPAELELSPTELPPFVVLAHVRDLAEPPTMPPAPTPWPRDEAQV